MIRYGHVFSVLLRPPYPQVPRPLCLVITPRHVIRYGHVFSVLLRLRFTSRLLHRAWLLLGKPNAQQQMRGGRVGRGGSSSRGPDTGAAAPAPALFSSSKSRRSLALWQHSAGHFVRCLQQHINTQLTGRVWRDFEAQVGSGFCVFKYMSTQVGGLLLARVWGDFEAHLSVVECLSLSGQFRFPSRPPRGMVGKKTGCPVDLVPI